MAPLVSSMDLLVILMASQVSLMSLRVTFMALLLIIKVLLADRSDHSLYYVQN